LCRLGARKVGNLIHRKGRGCALKSEPTGTVKGGGGLCVDSYYILLSPIHESDGASSLYPAFNALPPHPSLHL